MLEVEVRVFGARAFYTHEFIHLPDRWTLKGLKSKSNVRGFAVQEKTR